MKKKTRNIAVNVLTGICIIALIAGIAIVWRSLKPEIDSERGKRAAKEISGEDGYDWEALKAVNPEIVGWLKIPGTVVDYPVMQASDNEKYLDKGFDGNYDYFGSLFLDAGYNALLPESRNEVIYGHANRVSDRQMFAGLKHYKDREYFDAHRKMYYTRVEDGREPVEYEIMMVLDVDAYDNYRQMRFFDDAAFLAYMESLKKFSVFEPDMQAEGDDHIVTLSTCSYSGNNRIGIVARRVRDTNAAH